MLASSRTVFCKRPSYLKKEGSNGVLERAISDVTRVLAIEDYKLLGRKASKLCVILHDSCSFSSTLPDVL